MTEKEGKPCNANLPIANGLFQFTFRHYLPVIITLIVSSVRTVVLVPKRTGTFGFIGLVVLGFPS